jgi:hypothetical protein
MNDDRAIRAGVGASETQSEHEGGESTRSRVSTPEAGHPHPHKAHPRRGEP